MKNALTFVLVFLPALSICATCFASPNYYKNDCANIEFRFLLDLNEKETGTEVVSLNGDVLRVRNKPIITSSDVAGISIEEDSINFYFYQKSWKHIRTATFSSKGKKLALIIEHKLICSPVLYGPLDKMAKMTSRDGLNIGALIKGGFIFETYPSFIEPEEVYVQFLKTWLIDNPNDKDAIYSVAYYYIPENDFSSCEKAIPYLEKIIESEPSDENTVLQMLRCLMSLKRYEKALHFAEQWTVNASDMMEWAAYSTIGEIYYEMGRYKRSIENYEYSLKLLKEYKIPKLTELQDRPDENERLREHLGFQNYEEDSKEMKQSIVTYLEERIELLKKKKDTN